MLYRLFLQRLYHLQYGFYAPRKQKICWKDKIKYNKYILQTGISLVISTVSMTIYSRINQFSVSFIEGSYDLGVYSVALTLGTAWGFVGNAVAISFLSKIYAETDDHKAMEITAGLSLGIIFLLIMFPCVFIFIGPWVIQILYGNDYSAAYPVAVILCFSTIISTLGFVSNRFIVRFSGYNYLSKRQW
ncbi:oligosaccharide flippase family protein [Klebsiella pneumoniae]|uniref:oligosaccharide flippase family protein n=1 Tax=Klebsiella pneumoniae TaxID=573 RepID=UPI002B3FFEC3|nr:oligosaccharide flippase family protein [Klebsiella pneumoniae]